MAAYASLVVLAKNIHPIHGDLIHAHQNLDLKPLYENLVQLQSIMEDCPGDTLSQEFQARIRDFGYTANIFIEARYIRYMEGWNEQNHKEARYELRKLTDKATSLVAKAQKLRGVVVTKEARYIRYIEGWNKQNHKIARYIQLLKDWNKRNHLKARYKLRKLTDKATSLVAKAHKLRGVVVTKDPVRQMKESSSCVYAPGDAKRKVRLYSDTAKLKERLYVAGSSPRQVIPIVGMGGSGKTTLANVLFNDSRTTRHFDRRVWLTVSQNYDKCRLLSEILRYLKESAPEIETYGDLGEKVHKALRCRRYLVVIDDVWSEKLWDDVNIFLPDDGNGSRILLTTRLGNVANYVVPSSDDYDESYIHRAELMDLDSSWSLLKDTVFGQDGDCPVELEGIGRSIAQDCCGLPLAIVVVAGVLSSTNNKKEFWEKIAANVKTTIKSDGIEKVLSLSYVNLPHHLKPCFLHLACFPEDYEIIVFELILFWITEGYVNPNQFESCEVEKVAYEYLEDLVKKNLVLVSKTEYNDKIFSIHLHDMVRDLCIEIAQKENFMCQVKGDCESTSEEIKGQIRLIICSETDFTAVENIHGGANIKSILNFDVHRWKNWGPTVSRTSFRFLRVLDVVVYGFPMEVLQLFLLRYLAISGVTSGREDRILVVPPSIRNLQLLEVLWVHGWDLLLPSEIWEMPKLRHLISNQGIGLQYRIISGPLENLQTLGFREYDRFSELVMQKIPNVKHIKIDLDSFRSSFPSLAHLEKLEILSISLWRDNLDLHVPHSLRELSLIRCVVPWSNLVMAVGSLPNLEAMTLVDCSFIGKVWEVKEGEFPKLKLLKIIVAWLLVSWKYVGDGSIFPCLEYLELRGFGALKEFPWCIGEIATLRKILVDSSDKLLMKWAREVKEEQESYGNEYPEVIVPEEEEEEEED